MGNGLNNANVKKMRMENTEGRILSENKYNIVIGLTLLWGILINVAMAYFLTPYIVKIDIRFALIGYLLVSIGCMTLVMKTRRPALGLLGFTGLAVAMGFMLTFFISSYTAASVYTAFLTTGIIVVTMMIISTIFPTFFLSIGRTLVFALLGSFIIELVGGLIFGMSLGFMDYVIVIIFAGFIGFDWAKAQAFPKTVGNAISSAADIYVDLINIFIRVLSIVGKKD